METYKVIFKDGETEGVYGISLVENPAMESMFIALAKKETKVQLKVVNEEKRMLLGAVLIPDKPIYRKQGGKEFNIVFPAETVRLACHNFSRMGYNKNSTLEHNEDVVLSQVAFVENWIKEDDVHDKSIAYGLNEPNNTWFSLMKVDNEEVWNDYIKTGKVTGFSIDGFFDLEKINLNSDKMDLKSITEAIKEGFASLGKKDKVSLGKAMTKDQSLTIEFDGEELVAGAQLFITSEGGEKLPVPDGEYILDNDMVLMVEGGLAKEMKPKEVEAELEAEVPKPEAEKTPGVKSEKHTQEVFYQLAKTIGTEMQHFREEIKKDLEDFKTELKSEKEATSLTKEKGVSEKKYEDMTSLEKRRYDKQNS